MALPAELRAHLRLPMIGAPMFLVSGPELVVAQCRAGIVGALPALNARPASRLGEWISTIRAALAADPGAAPFAVNLIVHRSNDRLEADLAACVEARVPIVITSLGARPEINAAVHGYGGLVLHDVVDDRFARKAIEKGADGLVAVAVGAGGHAGALSPFALVQEIRAWFEGPLALAGAIATGAGVLAAEAMGADLAYVGSPFIATREARSTAGYRRMVVESAAADLVNSAHFSGIPVNYLRDRCAPPASIRMCCRRRPAGSMWERATIGGRGRGATSGARGRGSVPSATSCRRRNGSNASSPPTSGVGASSASPRRISLHERHRRRSSFDISSRRST
jgi:nitronate monooxygenase